MAHVFFFGYAHENLDSQLKGFFEDLCESVAPATPWSSQDPNISFRDGKDLPLMDNWRASILDALQTSAVFVAVTSPAYFQKKFCGQEYYIFDQRRQQALVNGQAPEVILPVVWYPITQKLPFIRDIQLDDDEMSPLYRKKGLRYLRIADRGEYEKCVLRIADAIQDAWTKFPSIPMLQNVLPFDQIPNQFAGGDWEEAIDPQTRAWIPGPGVVNFVFAAGLGAELQDPPGRYGPRAADWRPYLPPVPKTIEEIARAAAKKHSLKYRQIVVDQHIAYELTGTQSRKNLTLVLADPRTLALMKYSAIQAFDTHTWAGTSLMILWDGPVDPPLQNTIAQRFPIKSLLQPPLFRGPVTTANELDDLLDRTLAELSAAMTESETRQKAKIDNAPPQINSAPGTTP
jgi:hypothetical protein